MWKPVASIALFLAFFLTGGLAFADVWVKYGENEWREGRIVKEDQWGTLVELKNALTNQYDPPGTGFRAYYTKDRISPTKPPDANAPAGTIAPNTAFKPGQTVQFNDNGKMADGIVVRQDAYGVLVKYRNWATGKFDGDFQAYHPANEVQAGNPTPGDLPAATNNPMNPVGGAGPAGGAGPVGGAGPQADPVEFPNGIPVEFIHNDPNWQEHMRDPNWRAWVKDQMAKNAIPGQAAVDPAKPANPDLAAKPVQAAPVEFPKGIPIEFINNDPNWQEHMKDPNWRAWVKDQMDRNVANPAQPFVDPGKPANPVQPVNPAQKPVNPAQNPANPGRDPWLPAQPAGPNGVPPLQLPNNPVGLGGPVMTDKDVLDFLEARLGPDPYSRDVIERNIRDGVMKDLQAEILSRGVTPAANYSAIENNEFVKKLRFYGTPDFVNSSLTQGIGEPIKDKEWYYGTWDSTHVSARNQDTIEKGKAGGLTITPDGKYKWINGDTTYEGNWRLATKPEMDVSYKGGVGIVLEGARGGRPFIVTEDDEHGNTVNEGIRIQDLEHRQDQTRAGR